MIERASRDTYPPPAVSFFTVHVSEASSRRRSLFEKEREIMAAAAVDVAVVGGGISGLTAAYELKKKLPQLNICVLEAQDRSGKEIPSGTATLS